MRAICPCARNSPKKTHLYSESRDDDVTALAFEEATSLCAPLPSGESSISSTNLQGQQHVKIIRCDTRTRRAAVTKKVIHKRVCGHT